MSLRTFLLTACGCLSLAFLGCASPRTMDAFRNKMISSSSDSIKRTLEIRNTPLSVAKDRLQKYSDTCLLNLRTKSEVNSTRQVGSMTFHDEGVIESLYTPTLVETDLRVSLGLQRKMVSGKRGSPFVEDPEKGEWIMVADVERGPGGVLQAFIYTKTAEMDALSEHTSSWIKDTKRDCPKLP